MTLPCISRFTTIFAIILMLIPTALLAQWRAEGVPMSNAANAQNNPLVVSDGANGAIMVWVDNRTGSSDIYAQRVSSLGVPMWIPDGVVICSATGIQSNATIVSDGAGGAIITWNDLRSGNSDIYAQRINAMGVVQWTANGVVVCNAASTQLVPTIVSDAASGAIIAWQDLRSGAYDIYAQRLNGSGIPQWTANGVLICNAASDQYGPVLVTDGANGAIITWYDFRNGSHYDIYAQRINGGATSWAVNGVPVCVAAGFQDTPTIVSDNDKGAIIAWNDARSGLYDIYAQRLSPVGTPMWSTDGTPIIIYTGDQIYPSLVSDGASGAIVGWTDYRGGSTSDLYTQRITASGVTIWALDGVAICTTPNNQQQMQLVADGSGGATMAWTDFRASNWDIYTQRVNNAGATQWGTDGVNVVTQPGTQSSPSLVWDGTAAILAWSDGRAGFNDIYAQRIEGRYGYWGRPEPTLSAAADVPADQGGHVKLNWYASGRDVLNQSFISHYSIWRAVDAAAVSGQSLVDVSQVGKEFAGPVYRAEKIDAVDYFWQLVGTQDAIYRAAYSFSAPTTHDSTASNNATHQFQIVSHAYYSQYINWPSNILSARSVDNLAPAAPFLLTATRVGADVNLKWNRPSAPDLRDYAVYRATASGVTPVPIHFLASSDDTLAVDSGAPASALYYIVTAYDVHANQSAPSNEAQVQPLTGIGNTPSIASLTVLQNQPNPFNGTTDLRVGLPVASDVSIDVYDVAGRRVRSQVVARQGAGWRTIAFDGRDDRGQQLASGVYFYRVRAAGTTVTNKMVIAR